MTVKGKYYRTVRAIFAALLSSIVISHLQAQPFEATDIPFAGAGRSEVAWADFDNDHDLDVLVTGTGPDNNPVTLLYRNDSGSFSESGIPFVPLRESSAAWGDYDADGDLDLLMCGNSPDGDVTLLYRNDGGGFTGINPGLPGIQNGDLCWVDYDHDADLDIFLTGNWITQIYLNDDGNFTSLGQGFGYFSSSSGSFGDYDQDGDLDLLITGDSGAGATTKIFRNDAGIFTDTQAGLAGLMSGTTHWIDYDSDGDLDVAVSGFNDALEAQFCLYKNEGTGLNHVFTGIEGFALGGADWGDFDLDGDPDLVFSGKATGCGAVVSGIYRNDGNGLFYKMNDDVTPATRSSLRWADFENDGDLDFILAGLNLNDYPVTRLYLNMASDNQFTVNSAPLPPDILTSAINENSATFSWSGASDLETNALALNYNIMIGRSPGTGEIISPMSVYPSGYRMTTGNGNCRQFAGYTLYDLEPGVYYWSVQSIDQAFEGSAFSTVKTFTIEATGLDELNKHHPVSIWPNPAHDVLNVGLPESGLILEVAIYNLAGQKVLIDKPGSHDATLDISRLKKGVYLLYVYSPGEMSKMLFTRY